MNASETLSGSGRIAAGFAIIALFCGTLVAKEPTRDLRPFDVTAESRKIDKVIEAGYKEHGVKPNPAASDEIFVRRIYLDVVGRIPTLAEVKRFLDSPEKNKRSKLIDELLDSEGYVSHQFNYFADLLRIQSRMRFAPAKPYIDFVKDSLRENKPYDQFVRELLTAEGYTWENGAAGYYLRDTGMPLDNMSNTVQVFLGTQLVCAQCHDHPFDSWTQKQYYELAAFTYGVQTRDRRNQMTMEVRKMRRNKSVDQEVARAASRLLLPLSYRVNETKRPLRLPDDYQYSDGDPKDQVNPKTIFGEDVVIKEGDSPRDIYARWMTSKKNPRFATVIANRLWKRAMGMGVIEPVDDIKDDIEPVNPRLMALLTRQMVRANFDMKQFLRVVYNTKTYQREVTTQELGADDEYHFPGPVLRRMTAEQLWDSMLAMTLPELDERKGVQRESYRYSGGEELAKKDIDQVMKMAEVEAKRRKARYEYQRATADLRKDLRVAQKTQDRTKTREIYAKIEKVRQKIYGKELEKDYQKERRKQVKSRVEKDPRWTGFSRDLVRASEVTSPARPGHFLRQFGQSDRETIENANNDATVPQILTLLNGPVYGQMFSSNSVFRRNLEEADTARDKLQVIYLTILSRIPTEREEQIALPILESNRKGVADVVWALLNTRQFMFVQ